MSTHGNIDRIDLHELYISKQPTKVPNVDSPLRSVVAEPLRGDCNTSCLRGTELSQKITSVSSRTVTSRL